uniref:2-C-methyl-D-erythritol 4-phosphate cytidylyltransferase n=1 Tax=Loigolactobacillus rennini TaxID=238013 RepID=A0A1K2I9P1_9LACO|nr:2-C-methyl-D-erythritol 4-phosphate cytidylyltransferase [Loigolactobacillus rennini]
MKKNIALVFAGGVGERMHTKSAVPKQFLEVDSKPIIIYTLEKFEDTPEIDGIVISIVDGWKTYLQDLIKKFNLKKVLDIVEGGKNTQMSQYNALRAISNFSDSNTVVLIHDGVRPLVDVKTIQENIRSVRKYGSAITASKAIETISKVKDQNNITEILDRKNCRMAKAPQSYFFDSIYALHKTAIADGKTDFIDSATMMNFYHKKLHIIEGSMDNIKITTPIDYYIFKAIIDARKGAQIFGY